MKNSLGHPVDSTPNLHGSRSSDSPGKAMLCALVGGALLTLNDGLVKALTVDFPTGQVLAMRGMFIYFMIAIFALRAGGLHTMWLIKSWRGQGLRGFCVIGGSFAFVTGLSYMPLADAIAISFAGPLFVTAMAPFMLGERIGWRRWVAVLIGFAGVVFIIQPGTTAFQWFAIFPLGASFLGGMRDIITRKMAATETTVSVLFVTTTAVVLSGWSTIFYTEWMWVEWHHVKYIIGSGLLIGVGHYLLIEAFRLGEAALVSPFKYSNVLWAAIFGYLLFGDVPEAGTIIGALVVSLSGVYILHREHVRSK